MGSQIINKLPKDVRLIVYWYVTEYNYDRVKQQYKLLWIGSPKNKSKTYWSKNRHTFAYKRTPHIRTYVANWRGLNGYTCSRIYTFKDRNIMCAKLPPNY